MRKRTTYGLPNAAVDLSSMNSTFGVPTTCATFGFVSTTVLKQWMMFGWLSRNATSNRPAVGSLIRALYSPGSTSRRLRSMTSAARATCPRLG
ncbi:hypothetical protein D3C87_1374070 [compost metagenome]